jgi:excisionase family DNA binding protein
MGEELTISEAIRSYPGISAGHLTRLCQRGVMQARRIGPLWLVSRESLESWLANRPQRGGYRGKKPKQSEGVVV